MPKSRSNSGNELGGNELADNGFEQVRGDSLRGGQLRLQPVHEGHQLIDFGYYATLFSEGWDGDGNRVQLHLIDLWHCDSRVRPHRLHKESLGPTVPERGETG